MRPDLHKRRKNAIYKKAHGIVRNKTSKTSEKTLKTNTTSRDKSNITSIKEKLSEEENDEEEEDIITQQFSRRKIENNWEKYEKDLNERKEGDDGQDKSDDDSAYNLELSLKTKFKIQPPSWKELGNIIYVSEEDLHFVESTDSPTDLNPATESLPKVNHSDKKVNEEKYVQKDKLLTDLELITKDIKPVVLPFNGVRAKKNLVDLEKDLDDLLSL